MKKDKNVQHYRKSPQNIIPDALSGSIHQVVIEKTVPGGLGLCRIDGQVVFVPGVLPNESIRIKLGIARGGYREASVVEMIQPSLQRIAPPCPVYGQCGGCDFQYAPATYQMELKHDLLCDTLKRQGGLDVVVENLSIDLIVGEPWAYRNRMQFHPLNPAGGPGPQLGLMARETRRVIGLAACPVASREIQQWLATFPKFESGTQFADSDESPFEDTARLSPTGQKMRVFGAQGGMYTNSCELSLSLDGKLLHFSSGGFFQSNTAMLEKLLGWLTQRVGSGQRAYDLYCGCGVFAATLEPLFTEVQAVDNLAVNCGFATRNTDPARTRIFQADIDQWLKAEFRPAADLVVVDPPRAGLSRSLVAWLIETRPRRIAYVSCNPVTFSRDLKLLRAGGYHVVDLALFDFYPQTWHVETACILEAGPLP